MPTRLELYASFQLCSPNEQKPAREMHHLDSYETPVRDNKASELLVTVSVIDLWQLISPKCHIFIYVLELYRNVFSYE